MSKNRRSGTVFYCFSPPIMLATFIIEASLLAYILFRYKMTALSRLTAAILACLVIFQLAEYNVCGQAINADGWSRGGFAAITMLPALGVHLLQIISKRGWFGLKWIAYASSTAWVAIFALAGHAFNPHVCGGNYIIFHLTGDLGGAFFIFYYFWLILSILLCAYFARTAVKNTKQALLLLILGYSVFFVPTVTINKLNPETTAGVTSIMCGFAIIYAFILVFAILPRMKVPLRK